VLKKLERKSSHSTYPAGGAIDGALRRGRSLLELVVRSFFYIFDKPAKLSSLRLLKNSRRGKCALVIANGPSAERLRPNRVGELQSLGKLEVFVMNGFYKSVLNERIISDHYVLSDPSHSPDASEFFEALWLSISKGASNVFCPRTWKIDSRVVGPERVVHFEDRSLELWSKNTSPVRPRGYPSMTAYKALAIANYMGFEKIYVVGLDNSMFLAFEVDEHNRIVQRPNHAGGSGGRESANLSNPFPGGVADYFYDLAFGAHQLKKLFGKYSIVNLDRASFTDTFTKFDELDLLTPK
jgi:hypothetical protein